VRLCVQTQVERLFLPKSSCCSLITLLYLPLDVFIQDAKNNVDADLVMLEELKVKCRTQTEQIMAWKKAYSMQVIDFY
jgi:hypothetical protein